MTTTAAPAVVEPRPAAAQRARRAPGKSYVALLVALTSGAAALGAKLTIGGGDDGVGAFDALVLFAVLILYRRAHGGLPRRFSIVVGVVCIVIAIGAILPMSGHLVVRSAGAVIVLQAIAVSARFSTAIVRGFLVGTLVHVGIGLAGYVAAGGITVTEQTFADLRSYRSSFDWLAGPLESPPLSTSGLLRLQGLTGHPNEFAMLVVIAAMVTVRAVRNSRYQAILVAIYGAAAMLALSRIAIVLLAVGLVFGSKLGGRRVRRGLVVLGGALAALLALSPSIRDRIFNVDDDENAQIRSAGPLDLVNDATLWPDTEVLTRHNSLAFMIDIAGVVIGILWILALCAALTTVVRPGVWRREWGLTSVVAIFFLTEDRIQAPSFLLATLVCFAIALQAQHWPGGFDPRRQVTVVPTESAYHLRRRRRATSRQLTSSRSNHPATPRPNAE